MYRPWHVVESTVGAEVRAGVSALREDRALDAAGFVRGLARLQDRHCRPEEVAIHLALLDEGARVGSVLQFERDLDLVVGLFNADARGRPYALERLPLWRFLREPVADAFAPRVASELLTRYRAADPAVAMHIVALPPEEGGLGPRRWW